MPTTLRIQFLSAASIILIDGIIVAAWFARIPVREAWSRTTSGRAGIRTGAAEGALDALAPLSER